MKAQEARDLTNRCREEMLEHIDSSAIHFLTHIHEKIKEKAQEGEYLVRIDCSEVKFKPIIGPFVMEAVIESLREDGFIVNDTENPYLLEISW